MNKNTYNNLLVCENKETFIHLFMRSIEVEKYFFNNAFVFCYPYRSATVFMFHLKFSEFPLPPLVHKQVLSVGKKDQT